MIQLPQPKYAAVVEVFDDVVLPVRISFTRIPDSDVLAEIKAIGNTPGFKVFETKVCNIEVVVPLGYSKIEVGEAIAQGLEQHGLSVQRMKKVALSNPVPGHATHEMKEVEAF